MKRLYMGAEVYNHMSAKQLWKLLGSVPEEGRKPGVLFGFKGSDGTYYRDTLKFTSKAAKRALNPLERASETVKFWLRKRFPNFHSTLYKAIGDAVDTSIDEKTTKLYVHGMSGIAEFDLTNMTRFDGVGKINVYYQRLTDDAIGVIKKTGAAAGDLLEQTNWYKAVHTLNVNPAKWLTRYGRNLLDNDLLQKFRKVARTAGKTAVKAVDVAT